MARFDCDVLIVGSGFGGSVCAMRAAAAGRMVIVLERGPRLTPDLREQMAEGSRPLLYAPGGSGPIERARVRGLAAVTANAVGGGSQLYTSVTVPAPESIFRTGWPDGLNAETLRPYYRRVHEMISPTPIPQCLGRTRALEAAGNSLGGEVTRLPLAMDWPTDTTCMNHALPGLSMRREVTTWLQGGAIARKRTLDQTYLAQAEGAGAQIRPLHEVTVIERLPGGYQVRFRRYEGGGARKESLTARQVVLAAGALGTVRLLLYCRDCACTLPDLSPALGERFFTNGDFGGLLIGYVAGLARDSGPPVTAWVDWWEPDRLYLMETGLLPPLPKLFARALGILAPSMPGKGRAQTAVWSFGVMGFDDTPNRLSLDRGGRLTLIRPRRDASVFHERTMARMAELAAELKAKLIVPPKSLAPPGSVTVHPLGGAAMADDPQAGVTDSSGGVFGFPGLFVADGSLLPTPVGRAPSMTIAALAERVAERLTSAK